MLNKGVKMKKIIFAILVLLLVIPLAAEASVTRATYDEQSEVGAGFIALLSYEPSPAQPGNYLTLFIKVENKGGDKITDALYRLESKYPFSLKKGEEADRHFGTIGSQQQVLLEYDLYIDEKALEGTHDIILKLCLNHDCSNYLEKKIEIYIQTGGIPGIEVGLENFDIFSGGKKGTVTLNIVNRGDLDVKYLVMELMPTEQFEILSPNRIYIGEMESDDFETAEFDIFVYETVAFDAGQRMQMPVYLDYLDVNDKKYSETRSTYLKVYSPLEMTRMGLKQDNTKLYYAIGAIAGLVALFVIYRHFKKKEKS